MKKLILLATLILASSAFAGGHDSMKCTPKEPFGGTGVRVTALYGRGDVGKTGSADWGVEYVGAAGGPATQVGILDIKLNGKQGVEGIDSMRVKHGLYYDCQVSFKGRKKTIDCAHPETGKRLFKYELSCTYSNPCNSNLGGE